MALSRAKAHRALQRIEEAGQRRAHQLAENVVEYIRVIAPVDNRARRETYNKGPHLKDSYYVRTDPETGDAVIKCQRRYWVYVEFGTRKRNFTDEQPHVRPAVEIVRAIHS